MIAVKRQFSLGSTDKGTLDVLSHLSLAWPRVACLPNSVLLITRLAPTPPTSPNYFFYYIYIYQHEIKTITFCLSVKSFF